MRLKTPSFWYDEKSPVGRAASFLLGPASALYALGQKIHQAAGKPELSEIPVICIGNLVAGGSGKTPVALAVMEILKKDPAFRNPVFLTRGYGGKSGGPLKVDPAKHTAADVGDEPLLLARAAPVIAARDRKAGTAAAKNMDADIVVMDDGLQNPFVTKTLSLVVIDGASGFGNTRLLPAGPLREPLQNGLSRADAFVIVGPDGQNAIAILPEGPPVFWASLIATANEKPDRTARCVAFAVIGRPEKFRKTLVENGFSVASWHPFADHHPYTERELKSLAQTAKQMNAHLITTEKDYVRLPASFIKENKVETLPVRLMWEDGAAVARFLKERLNRS